MEVLEQLLISVADWTLEEVCDMSNGTQYLEVVSTELKRCDLIKLSGRIDSSGAPKVEDAFKAITDQGRFRIVLDMNGVDFASSAFLRVLIKYLKLCKRWNRGDVRLAALQPRVAGVFDLAGLTPLFQIYPDNTLAVGSF
jgi:anti-sigma B factor antagonist